MKRIFLNKSKKQVQQVETPCVASDSSNETMSIEDKVKTYLNSFLQPRVLKQRQSVYISQDVHEFVTGIVKKLGDKNITVGVFIDTVMAKHIKEYAEELRAIYYKKEADIFKNIDNGNL
jgi:hypothetical protein